MSDQRRLGRGLGALLGDYQGKARDRDDADKPRRLPVHLINPNPRQPRVVFDPSEIDRLAESIATKGLLQPALVRQDPATGRYELIAGERRLIAVRKLGWRHIPVRIRESDDRDLLVLSLVENLQRRDLDPLEEAQAYQALRDDFNLKQAEIARSVGRSRSTVANMIRLLQLPPPVREMVREGRLTVGHARALLAAPSERARSALAQAAADCGWTVRETEREARRLKGADGVGESNAEPKEKPADPEPEGRERMLDALQRACGTRLEAKVRIRWKGKGSGMIQIGFRNEEELGRLITRVTGEKLDDIV